VLVSRENKLSDDAENNTVVASAGSNNTNANDYGVVTARIHPVHLTKVAQQ